MLKKIILIGTISFTGSLLANTDRQECIDKIQRQGQLILAINRKATAMPPLTSVYVYASGIWKNAINEKDLGNFKECNRLLDISIKYSEPYAR